MFTYTPAGPVGPCGIVKFNIKFGDVPVIEAAATLPGAPVVTSPIVSVGVSASKPAGPVGPISPCGPVAPVAPSTPSKPAGPVGPISPAIPCGPVGPVAPSIPFKPAGPVGPVAPIGPVGPLFKSSNKNSQTLSR